MLDIDLKKLPSRFWVGLGLEFLGAVTNVFCRIEWITIVGLAVFGVGLFLCMTGIAKAQPKPENTMGEPSLLTAVLPRSYFELLIYVAGAAALIVFRHPLAEFVFAGITDHRVGPCEDVLLCIGGIIAPIQYLVITARTMLNAPAVRCYLIALGLVQPIGFFALFMGLIFPWIDASVPWRDVRFAVGMFWLVVTIVTHWRLKIPFSIGAG